MNTNGQYPTLAEARILLPGVVFLSIDPATKSPIHGKKWQQITYEQSQKEGHQRLLEAADSVGVLLGPPSNNIAVLDCDSMPFLEAVLVSSPFLNDTLHTHGNRGGAFWLWMEDEYPTRVCIFAVPEGHSFGVGLPVDPKSGLIHIGEFRGGCGQSIVCGLHQSGKYYTWPNPKPPFRVKFTDFGWPADLPLPWVKRPKTRPAGPGYQGGGAASTSSASSTSSSSSPHSSEDTELLRRAKVVLTIPVLWQHFGFPSITGNPTNSPFRQDTHPSFSIYDNGNRAKDHATNEDFDSYDFYQRATGTTSKTAFKPFVTQAGLSAELRGQKTGGDAEQRDRLLLPSDPTDIIIAARNLFSNWAMDYEYFVRVRTVCELTTRKEDGQRVLQILDPDSLRSRIEYKFRCFVWRELRTGKRVLKETRCTRDAAVALLKTREAVELLPYISTLAAAPVITGELGHLQILSKGYHNVNGGIYVVNGEVLEIPPLAEAVQTILDVLIDYEFVIQSDKSRAVATILSPAFHFGGLINGDFPLDIAEADASQSGKTYRQKLICAIYGENPYLITKRKGGVGSVDESISSAIIAGSPFILFDNFRGEMDSEILESALRGIGYVNARIPHRGELQIPVKYLNWQISSNGLEATRDLCNRAIVTRICKQPEGYVYRRYSEGDLLQHIKANQAKFLGAVFAVVSAWDVCGRKRTDDYRHDFIEWSQTMDWIVQNLFNLPPLLDGHMEEILRISDPALSWLRTVAIAVEKDKRLDEALTASEVGDICQARGIDFPGVRYLTNLDQVAMVTGKLLNRLFHDSSDIAIDRYAVRRETKQEYNHTQRRYSDKHYTWFSKRTAQNSNNPF